MQINYALRNIWHCVWLFLWFTSIRGEFRAQGPSYLLLSLRGTVSVAETQQNMNKITTHNASFKCGAR